MRRSPSPSILLSVFFGSLLPVVALLTASYYQAIWRTQDWLNHEIRQSIQRTNDLLITADDLLNRIAADTGGKVTPDTLNIIRRTVYNDPRFREVGIINSQGDLVMTSLGEVKPPIPIPPEDRAKPSDKSLQVLGVIRTAVMREKSLILSLPTGGEGEVNLLVDPVVLTYFLDDSELGPDGFIAFYQPDGRFVAGVGSAQGRIHLARENQPRTLLNVAQFFPADPTKIHAQQSTLNGELLLAGEIPYHWALRYWWQNLVLGAPIALISSALLTWVFFRSARRTYGIEQDIRIGLDNNEFEVYYQPIIDLQTRQCVGSEALLRWHHPDLGLILPEVFIPIAEKTGLIRDLSEWVVQRVLRDQVNLPLGNDFYISVNLSPSLLGSQQFLDYVTRLLLTKRLSTHRILFEITENRLIETHHLENMSGFRNLGMRLALDDFGSGYSNLDYLDKFEFDYLKIDRRFVQRIQSNNGQNPIVDTLIELGQNLGLEIVAEGVETEVQSHYLQTYGVRYAQGWLFAKALPLEEFRQFLQHQPPS
jgi:sensor c-di-GMP phosphodiesterase-like protein